MPSYAAPPSAARLGDVAGTLRLLAYLALAIILIVLDHRGGWLSRARGQASLLVQPLWTVAGWPGRMVERISDDAGTLATLTEENRRLRQEALLNQARMARLQTMAADNNRLRGLLEVTERGQLDVVLAPVLDIDLDPTRQRLVLDVGSRDRVQVGQSVIDAGGLLGQVIGTTPSHSSILLVTDPSHAVPVTVARNGVRLVVYGDGRTDLLRLASVPLSSDVKVGDLLVTSGLGGRFPPGFPVGAITSLRPDDSRAFLVGDVAPSAQIDRGRDVLVLLKQPDAVPAAAAFGTPPPIAALPANTPTADALPAASGTHAAQVVPGAAAPGSDRPPQFAPPATVPATNGATAPATTPTTAPATPPQPTATPPVRP